MLVTNSKQYSYIRKAYAWPRMINIGLKYINDIFTYVLKFDKIIVSWAVFTKGGRKKSQYLKKIPVIPNPSSKFTLQNSKHIYILHGYTIINKY